MKILVLTKRQYMAKDLLDDCFGRFWELPLELARWGHVVQGITLSYRRRSEGTFAPSTDVTPGSILWHSVNLLKATWPKQHSYFCLAEKLVRDFQPNIVWACSDAYHAIIGSRLARNSATKLVIDLYDNFESYPATKIPGVRFLFKRSVRAADGVTCVSPQLANYVRDRYRSDALALVLENAIRADLFHPMERQDCRRRLRLPQGARLIGTAGALYFNRGIDTLYRAFEVLAAQDPTIHLAVAGPRPARSGIPRSERVHDLGILPTELVPAFFNALDVAVVCNRDSSFGRYNFPQKAREIIACRIPLVAAAVGSMNEVLVNHPDCLYEPENSISLANAMRRQLLRKAIIEIPVPSWADSAKQLAHFFHTLVDDEPMSVLQTANARGGL